MTLLPISVRELRVAARQRRTYVSRLVTAGVSVLIFAWMLWVMRSSRGPSGSDFFAVFSWLAFVYCAFAGVSLTADSLSSEKRENTLGLLFLTDLKGYDVIFGKLLGTSLNCFFGLLAMFPILAIPLIMGGVQLADFSKVALSLAITLFLSTTVGLVISTFSRHALRATTFALLTMLIITFGLAGLGELLRVYYKVPEIAVTMELFSPFVCLQKAMSGGFWVRSNNFWSSLTALSLIALALLSIASWILPRTWQDKPDGPKGFKWRERWRRFRFSGSESGRGLRTRWLARSPYYWVAGRNRFGSIGFLLFLVFIAGLANWIGWKVGAIFGNPVPISGFVFVWLWAVILAHAAFAFRIAAHAPHRFSQDRRSGALELILATPLETRRIVSGQYLALLREFAGPAVAVALLHCLFLFGFVEMIALERPTGMTGLELIRALLSGEPTGNQGIPREIRQILIIFITAGALIVLNWIAIAGVGMWIGLRTQHARTAPWQTLALVLIPPWAIFSVTMVWLDSISFLVNEIEFMTIGWALAVGLTVFHDLILSIWAWRRLRYTFRIAVTDRTLLAKMRRTWPQRARLFVRFALGAVCVWAAIALLYIEERGRGQRAWKQFIESGVAEGETFEIESVIPPPIPDEQNFASAPIFTALMGASSREKLANALTYNQLASINVNARQGWWRSSDARFGSWRIQRKTDLNGWTQHFTNQAIFPKAPESLTPAQHVLKALTKFESELSEVAEAAERPRSRFRIDYAETAFHHAPQREILHNFGELFHLRASAFLAETNSNWAFSDLKTLIRLGEALKVEPLVESHKVRGDLIESAMQIVWEGLNQARWSLVQLDQIEAALNQLDLLADFQTVVHGETVIHIAKWTRIRELIQDRNRARTWSERRWGFARLIYPLGWTYLNQIKLHDFYSTVLKQIADPEHRRIYPENADLIHRSHKLMGAYLEVRNFPEAFHELATQYARLQAGLHLAEIACALERFRIANGHFPESLKALDPAYRDQLPKNLVSGEPMKYHPAGADGYSLYEFGWNGKDDGGSVNGESDWVWNIRFESRIQD